MCCWQLQARVPRPLFFQYLASSTQVNVPILGDRNWHITLQNFQTVRQKSGNTWTNFVPNFFFQQVGSNRANFRFWHYCHICGHKKIKITNFVSVPLPYKIISLGAILKQNLPEPSCRERVYCKKRPCDTVFKLHWFLSL